MSEKKATPAKIVIGYKTRLVAGIEKNLPDFKASPHLKDGGKMATEVKERQDEFLGLGRHMPYTATFDEIFLADVTNNLSIQWSSADGKNSPASRARKFFDKHYPDSWNESNRKSRVILIGFDIHSFLRILGVECALPGSLGACQFGMWYKNQDVIDVGDVIMPRDVFRGVPLSYIMKFWRPANPDDAKVWDGLVKDWNGPGENPVKDAHIASCLVCQMGLI